MSRFIVSPVAGNITRFVVNSEKVVGLVKTHGGQTLITVKVEGQLPTVYQVAEKFEDLALKLKDCFIKRTVVTPVESRGVAKFVVNAEKIVGLHENVQGEVMLSIRVAEFERPTRLMIEESIDAVLEAIA
ncbi:hypothetical protein CL89_gp303 [Aeromonas phage PX29]|uniref:Uncharacterized protein n=1 Tax=Aeromonas phage PX29 TaxID=926067 RepID=E5DQA8_9CAUD|nr:hypothetical protein CL89_gp303 [Aeromonas phage PX29]ADQ52894.1 conserved hypothetical protein [Aeromonas phage PX29]QAX98439.1 hypothetical protein ASfcp2_96 [Aeromonas phage AsFcp_2]